MSAGPDEVRDPVPNIGAALTAFERNGFSGSPIRPVVISLSSFTPASTRGPGNDRLVPADRHARHRDPWHMGHLVVHRRLTFFRYVRSGMDPWQERSPTTDERR